MRDGYIIKFDCEGLAKAFGVKPADVHAFMTDGRRASFMIERRLHWDNPGWKLAPTEGAGYDLESPDGARWEVRSITKDGVYFNPSAQVGKGRKFEEAGFLAKLDGIAGFILADITMFPDVPVYVVPVGLVRECYAERLLGKNARAARKKCVARILPRAAGSIAS